MGRRAWLGGPSGLPRELLAASTPDRDHAVLRRGVVPEMHSLPDRQPRHAPPARRARARPPGDAPRAGGGVARRHGRHLDLRSRPGSTGPDAKRFPRVARGLRLPGQAHYYEPPVISFSLDGKTVSAPEGELLVHAAARHG